MSHQEYIDAGFKVFGLHGVDNSGKCQCGNTFCKALYKHPKTANWQHTPAWSDDQIEVMEQKGDFDTGFGVLCDGYIVIDIDPRNGGSLQAVKEYYDKSEFVVETGGGGWHIYFKLTERIALKSHLPEYKGIDFKSSGYVVGAGSKHISGNYYEYEKGFPDRINQAPDSLINLLKKPEKHRTIFNGATVDISANEVAVMLDFVDPDCDYDEWIRIGMAIHNATDGEGFDVFDKWSSKGSKYNRDEMDSKWHSFGKCESPITIGTLIHYAEQNGYQQSVTFTHTENISIQNSNNDDLIAEMINHPFDQHRPPGFVGDLTAWVNKNCIYLRESLAVGASLYMVGSLAGCNYNDVSYGGVPNVYVMCIAESGSGKEGIIKACRKIFKTIGINRCVHPSIKSEQEIVRNLITDPRSIYRIDEFGEQLAKFDDKNAPAYLRGIKPTLLVGYSSSGSEYEIGGDLLRFTESELKKSIATHQKMIDENNDPNGHHEKELARKLTMLEGIDTGIDNFFLSLMGFSGPHKLAEAITEDSVNNGFVGRCMFFIEHNGNPRPQLRKVPTYDISMSMQMALNSIMDGSGDIITESKADKALCKAIDFFIDKADEEAANGMTPLWRRGADITIKTSLILALHERQRTFEHVAWAFNMARQECEQRANVAISKIASKDKDRTGEGLMRLIISKITKDHGESIGVIKSKCGSKYSKKDIEQALHIMAKKGVIISKKSENTKGPKTERWFLAS